MLRYLSIALLLAVITVVHALEPLPFRGQQLLTNGILASSTYDSDAHKIYFATIQGFGEYDINQNITTFVNFSFTENPSITLVSWSGIKFLTIGSGTKLFIVNPPLEPSLSPNSTLSQAYSGSFSAKFTALAAKPYYAPDGSLQLWITFSSHVPSVLSFTERISPRSPSQLYSQWLVLTRLEYPESDDDNIYTTAINHVSNRFYMAKSKPVTSIAHFDITNYLNATDESVLVQLEYITSGLLPPIRRIEADADTPTIFVASNALGNKYTYDPNGLSPGSHTTTPLFSDYLSPPLVDAWLDTQARVSVWVSQSTLWRVSMDAQAFSPSNNMELEDTGITATIFADSTFNALYVLRVRDNDTYIQFYDLSDCGSYSNCTECTSKDPDVCGWCVSDSGAECKPKIQCSSPEQLLLQSCPAVTSVSPSSGSIVGGATVTVMGSNFVNSSLSCQFGSLSPTPMQFITDSIGTCKVPNATSTGQVDVHLVFGSTPASTTPATFTYYDCSEYKNCSACSSADVPECGWCVSDGTCRSRFSDPVCPTEFSLFVTSSTTARCAELFEITPTTELSTPPPGATAKITAEYFLNSTDENDWSCDFGGVLVPGEVDTALNTIECPIPPSSSIGTVFVSVLYKGSTYGRNALQFSYYSCSIPTSCDTCIMESQPKCTWCLHTKSCGVIGNISCSDTSMICPTIEIVPKSLYELTSTTVSIIGGPFTSVQDDTYECKFGSTVVPATYVNSTLLTCDITAPNLMSDNRLIEPFSLLHAETDYVPPNNTFLFYNCDRASACGTCVDELQPLCGWCFNSQSCLLQSDFGSCDTLVFDCPKLISVEPSVVSQAGSIPLLIKGTKFFAEVEYSCIFTSPSNVETTVDATYFDSTTLVCTMPDFTGAVGNYTLEVMANTKLDAQLSLQVVDCALQTSCETCAMAARCGWCPISRTCVDNSTACSSGPQLDTCPSIDSVQPSHADYWKHRTVTVSGKLLNTDIFENSIDSLACAFGNSLDAFTMAEQLPSSSGDAISCQTPILYKSTVVPFAVYIVTRTGDMVLYAEGGTFDFFDCRVAKDCSTCVSSEMSAHCGWCLDSDSCTSSFDCQPDSWIKDTCPALFNVSRTFSDASFSTSITVTGQRFLPTLPLTCMFGDIPSPSVTIVDPQTMICETPITAGSGTKSTELRIRKTNSSANYADNFVQFDIVDCTKTATRVDVCSGCLPPIDPRCGWCRYDHTCTAGGLACTSLNPYNTFLETSSSCPTISSISPNSGPMSGGTNVTVTGTQFIPHPNLMCWFGSLSTPAQFIDENTILCVSPERNNSEAISVEFALFLGATQFSVDTLPFLYQVPLPPAAVTPPPSTIDNILPDAPEPWVFVLIALAIVVVVAAAIAAVVIVVRRRNQRKLTPPDFAPIAFGNNTRLMYPVPDSKQSTLSKLVSALVKNEYELAILFGKVASASEDDLLCKALIYVGCRHGFALPMLRAFIKHEVANSMYEGELFRSNSLACKMYTVYSKVIGLRYLWDTLAVSINDLNRAGEEEELRNKGEVKGLLLQDVGTLEVDPERLAEKLEKEVDEAILADVNISAYQLLLYCGRMFKRVIDSLPKVNDELRVIAHDVKSLVAPKFPQNNADYKAVGAFFFLRFICPAIMTPQIYGLLPAPPCETSQRYFVLISKTLQNLANETLPGAKEEYMAKMNEFVTDHINAYHKFIDSLSDPIALKPMDVDSLTDNASGNGLAVPDDLYWSSLAFLHEYLDDKLNDIKGVSGDNQDLADEIAELHNTLGAPIRQPKKAPAKKKRGKK